MAYAFTEFNTLTVCVCMCVGAVNTNMRLPWTLQIGT
jgi:hypothetical protein